MVTIFGSKIVAILMFSAFVVGLIILYFEHQVLEPKGEFSYTAYFAVGWAFVIIFLKYVFIDVLWKIWLKNKERKAKF